MNIKKIIDFSSDENCYILYDGKNCAVIDPGESFDKIVSFIKENALIPEKILLTHCHYDHSADTKKLKDFYKIKAAAAEECKKNIQDPDCNVSRLFGHEMSYDAVDEILKDGEEITVCGESLKVMKTPGHTDCSVCYILGNVIFSGDTLFSGSVGRWDFPTGNFNELKNSLKNKLYRLENMRVLPGHGEETTTDRERLYNSVITAD